ncbi:heavy-metal-associated domain-containing protein [Aromatoleum petrolei]|uniref:Heavy metal transporter n=1 Tax=Aromatoleum petrolei TaxID=76116 RepID=A0ABX1MMF6_9RHOO|nr:heavy-metal-associated domain-containing protein [Aromatoleum petrolei]NMF88953.1 heavy metal transporter [Aromatoleum petrolei]QTQ37814.1 Copper chaperone [Aromatoleum petrolei]
MAEVTIKVEDMSCGGCVRNVTAVLKALPGVSDVQVSLEAAQAVVRYDPEKVSVEAMRAAVEDAGFGSPA